MVFLEINNMFKSVDKRETNVEIREFNCVTIQDKIFEIGSGFKLFESSAYVFALSFSLHRVWADEVSAVAGKVFVGTIGEA